MSGFVHPDRIDCVFDHVADEEAVEDQFGADPMFEVRSSHMTVVT